MASITANICLFRPVLCPNCPLLPLNYSSIIKLALSLTNSQYKRHILLISLI